MFFFYGHILLFMKKLWNKTRYVCQCVQSIVSCQDEITVKRCLFFLKTFVHHLPPFTIVSFHCVCLFYPIPDLPVSRFCFLLLFFLFVITPPSPHASNYNFFCRSYVLIIFCCSRITYCKLYCKIYL